MDEGYACCEGEAQRVCSAVWDIVQDYRQRFSDNPILEELASDLEDRLAYGPEDV